MLFNLWILRNWGLACTVRLDTALGEHLALDLDGRSDGVAALLAGDRRFRRTKMINSALTTRTTYVWPVARVCVQLSVWSLKVKDGEARDSDGCGELPYGKLQV